MEPSNPFSDNNYGGQKGGGKRKGKNGKSPNYGMGAPGTATSQHDNTKKVFVGGLGPHTTNESLRSFFTQFGNVIDCNVMESIDQYTGHRRTRGFGFVVFSTEEELEAACITRHVDIDGKACEVKRIDEHKSSNEGKADIEQRKIFCGGLAETVDSTKLDEFFRQIDPNLMEARVMFDPSKGMSRCFGYVTFSDKMFVDKAVMNKENNQIDGKWFDCKPTAGAAYAQGGKNANKGKNKGGGGGGWGNDNWGGNNNWGNNNWGNNNKGGGKGKGKGGKGKYNNNKGGGGWGKNNRNNYDNGGGNFGGQDNYYVDPNSYNQAGGMQMQNGGLDMASGMMAAPQMGFASFADQQQAAAAYAAYGTQPGTPGTFNLHLHKAREDGEEIQKK
ncbi:unnamed protein product [Amoebophrya sp. A120]|nr:unnamed protein product [Amoebophrya sp. A120]|eukprot:GSA120T00001992001.1